MPRKHLVPDFVTERVKGTLKDAAGKLTGALPAAFKATAYLRAVGFLKIPLLFFVSPSVVELSTERCVVKIALNRRTKNHLNAMYFGVLAAGADCAGGLMAWKLIDEQGNKLNLVFKDFHAEFLKRCEGDVYFTCEEGAAVRSLVERALASGERETLPVHVTATVPSKLGTEPVAQFTLGLSLKRR